ncbi:unnamed protein product [Fraxinus pennsylvanica]|uniref:DEAD/DEAH-box helicase domain-containing protein n=1 Tax=Fraxinus pennsylvanica TaxID=56036 RepID=A0AAD2AEF1_9LAMI|nr:unnamed protein product [Fraxinus pennsylvanica]
MIFTFQIQLRGSVYSESSKSKAINEGPDQHGDDFLRGKKEYHRQLERDAHFRRKHNIHVSGSNVPSPLQNFAELRSSPFCISCLPLRDAHFRKKHNIHVSGSNIPSPLQNFAELRSRYSCRSYLLPSLAALGFKEPTPIRRQAIPVLLSGRECFACAPTASGKTFAFVCPKGR